MDILLIFLIILGVVVLALAVIDIFLFRKVSQSHKKIDVLLEKGNIKDFKDIFLSQNARHESLASDLEKAFSKIENLENLCETTIRKVGVIRFNPFNDMGGNQSFIIAMLDNKNDGFIISSLFVNDGNRVYTKAVKNGRSEHALSPQEIEAVEKAINLK